MVNVWEGVNAHAEAKDFCQLWGVEGTVLVDESGEVAERLGVRGVPTNVLVDSDGTVTTVGAATPEALEAAARRLLGPDGDFPGPETSDWHWQTDASDIERNIAARSVKET